MLDEAHIHSAVREKVARLHRSIVEEVKAAVEYNAAHGLLLGPNPFAFGKTV